MKFSLVIIVILCLTSCQDVKYPEAPQNLIPENKMVEVLTEAYLINAARSFDKRTITENKVKLDSFIYKKFDIDSLQFAENNAFYTSDLNTYNDLFVRVQERLNFLKVRVDSIHEIIITEEKRVQDSIDAIKKDSLGLDVKKDTTVKKGQLIHPAQTREL